MSLEQEQSESLKKLPEQIVRGLKALDNLALVALRGNAQQEMQYQIRLVAKALSQLAERKQNAELGEQLKWLAQNLTELAAKASPLSEEDENEVKSEMSEEEASRRLSQTIPSNNVGNPANPADSHPNILRRAVVASLEHLDSALSLITTATQSFDRERWNVTNLGYNVPIMALTSNVKEVKPGVLVLTVARGQLMRETAQLIQDLKKNFVGLKVIAVGPPFENNTNLGELLGADLFAPEAEKAAELAEQALSPLNRLSAPLTLELEEENQEEKDLENSSIEDVPTTRPSKNPAGE